MKPSQLLCLSSKTFIFLFLFIAFSHGEEQSLDSIIKKCAFEGVDMLPSGVVYNVSLPANLTGVEASTMKIRSRTFWLKGTNLSYFHFTPGILPVPNSQSLLLVSYSLGRNLSTSLSGCVTAGTAGYSLASPIIGLLAYDAWNMSRSELGFEQSGDLIKIEFPAAANSSARHCARFGEAGEFSLVGEEVNGRCSTNGPGRFGLVVADLLVQLPAPATPTSYGRKWRAWVAVCAGGLVLVCGLGILVLVLERRRVREMWKEAEEGEALEVVWVGGSKMPSAGLIRTQPHMESEL